MIIIKRLKQNHLHKFCFGSLVQTNYPYVFKGISQQPQSINQKLFLEKVFGNDVYDGFRNAYLAVLNALAEKDRPFLEGILEKRLTKNINFQDVNIYEYDENIKLSVGKSFIVVGGKFQRSSNQKCELMIKQDDKGLQMFRNTSFTPMSSIFSFPIIFGTKIYFSGKTKLQKEKDEMSKSEEVHMLQFQIQNTVSMEKIMKIMQTNKFQPLELMESIIGQNYEWRIGDIDNVLKGNLTN